MLVRSLILLLACAASSPGVAQNSSPPTGAWEYLQNQFYGARDIGVTDSAFMSIEAPANTPDPAATPVTLRFGAAAIGRIKQVRVIIDNNPSPLVSTFDFGPDARVAELGLRVRVDRFTSVRAIAETIDGALEMRSGWVNASGGCSAAPSATSGGQLGDMRFRPSSDYKSLLLSIRHPNNSGFQIDPASGDAIPPHYVKHIRFLVAGHTLVEADTGISLSENPTLLIASDQSLPTPVTVEVTDSKEAHFSRNWERATQIHGAASDAQTTP